MHLSIKQDVTTGACFYNGVTIKIKGEEVTDNEGFQLLSTSHGSGAMFSDFLPGPHWEEMALLVLFTGRKLPYRS